MTITVNGVIIPAISDQAINIEIQVDHAGEMLPQVNVTVTGGTLEVFPSHVHREGSIVFHLFGEG